MGVTDILPQAFSIRDSLSPPVSPCSSVGVTAGYVRPAAAAVIIGWLRA